MNVFTCMLLSSRQQAYTRITSGTGLLVRTRYVLKVSRTDTSTFIFAVFLVLDASPPKQKSDVHIAENPHYSIQCSKQELEDLLTKHEFDELIWYPVEAYTDFL